MISIDSIIRRTKHYSKIDPETGERYTKKSEPKPEQIKLIRVKESNGNYHNDIEVDYENTNS